MFKPNCELLEERVVPCVKAVVCPPPPTCHVSECHTDHHDNKCPPPTQHCQPVQNCNDHDKCQPVQKQCNDNNNNCSPTAVNGNAIPTDIHYIINGSTDVTSLDSTNLKSGDTVKVEFTVAKGSEPTTFSFVSYTAPNGNFNEANLEGQKIYDSQEVTTGCNGGTYCLTVKVPCDYFQVDFVSGCPITQFTTTNQYHAENRYYGGTQGGQESTCPPVTCTPPTGCDNHNKPVCDDHNCKPPVNDCKPPDHCLDNYFCHDNCCDHECVTNITNNYNYTTNNYTTNNTYNDITNITNNYNVVNQPPANYYNLPPVNNNNNNQQFFSNNSETSTVMANNTYSSTGGTAPNIHDMTGPTVMGGSDDVTPSHDVVKNFLHPNGDGGGFKLDNDDSQQQPCTPCLPAPSPFDACFPQYQFGGCGRR